MHQPAGGPQRKPKRSIGVRRNGPQGQRIQGIQFLCHQAFLVRPFKGCHVREVQVPGICELLPQEPGKRRSDVMQIAGRGGMRGKKGDGELPKVLIPDEASDHRILKRKGLLESFTQIVSINPQTSDRIDAIGADPRNNGCELVLEQMRRE